MKIGPYLLDNNLILAPMAGITDKPYRQLCRELGAGMVVSEMVSSNPACYGNRKTILRSDLSDECSPRVVQVAGADPGLLAAAARSYVDQGAEVIDINMGCPVKKVCNVQAGSALLKDEPLVEKILTRVVNAVDVPVTLKIRTGWDTDNRNAVRIASLAEQSGIQALTIHGRTRACRFNGRAEHYTTREVKSKINIPVIANGDIDSPEEAARVLEFTNADGLMIGRAAQGNPWIFAEINHYLATGEKLPRPRDNVIKQVLILHVRNLHAFYGEYMGARVARKHIAWYCRNKSGLQGFMALINRVTDPEQQIEIIKEFFNIPIFDSSSIEDQAA